jgi:hypothetical protein
MTFKLRVQDQHQRIGTHLLDSELAALQLARDLSSAIQKGTIVDLTLPDGSALGPEEVQRRISRLPPSR